MSSPLRIRHTCEHSFIYYIVTYIIIANRDRKYRIYIYEYAQTHDERIKTRGDKKTLYIYNIPARGLIRIRLLCIPSSARRAPYAKNDVYFRTSFASFRRGCHIVYINFQSESYRMCGLYRVITV